MLERLREELAKTTELVELLRQETAALRAHSAADLEALAAPKAACVEALQRISERRVALLAEQGRRMDREGMDAALSALPATERAAAQALWAELLQAAAAAQAQNDINGTLIGAGRAATERALAILQGRNPDQASLYGQRAQPTSTGGSRPLGKA